VCEPKLGVRICIRIGSVGSLCFRASRIRSGSGSFHHQANIVRKTLILTVLWLLFDFLSSKNDVTVPVFRIRIRIRMFLGLSDPHPDPLTRGTDPRIRIRIRIRTTMSGISNAGMSYKVRKTTLLTQWKIFVTKYILRLRTKPHNIPL
jgi:hypothetical protein